MNLLITLFNLCNMEPPELFISVSSPEESRKVADKLVRQGYEKYYSFNNKDQYIKVYEERVFNSFDDEYYADDHKRVTAAEFLGENPGLPECFYVNVPTLPVAEAVKEKLISLGYFIPDSEKVIQGKAFICKDKSFGFRVKDYIWSFPKHITEEVSLDRLFATPETPRETEIPGILAAPYTIFKKESDYSHE